MRLKYIVFLLFIATAAASPVEFLEPQLRNVVESDDPAFRLPTTIIPQSYAINLNLPATIFEGTTTEFTGTVTIVFSVQTVDPITSFQIHAPMTITSMTMTQVTPTTVITATPGAPNPSSAIVTVQTGTALTNGQTYNLVIGYTGQVDALTMQGLYRSSYVTAAGVTEYLLTTQFQPDYARRAFPCFDEPQYKATFALTVTYPTTHIALFNTQATGDPAPAAT